MGVDTPSDELYNIDTTQYVPPMLARHKLQPRLPKPDQGPSTFPRKQTNQRWTCPIYLPACIYKLLSQEVKDALQKYYVEAIQKLKSTRNLHEINFVHDLHESTQDDSTSSNKDDQSQDCQEFHPDQDLEPAMDDLLDFINNQHHSDDQLDQVLQTYQTYTESQSPTRQLNAHINYHVIEWYTNIVDDKSVQVGGKQRIVMIDGYIMPLVCKGELMYLKFQGIPTDKDLQTCPSVYLTSPQQGDPSVLDYVHPEDNGEPNWTNGPKENSI